MWDFAQGSLPCPAEMLLRAEVVRPHLGELYTSITMSNILILDGGLGTSLEQRYGVCFDESKPLWSSHLLLNGQDTLTRCQQDFGNIPVDIILTATYQLSLEAFEEQHSSCSSSQFQKALEDSVRIAEKAKQAHAQVALSVGPYGATMRPSQEYSGEYGSNMERLETLYSWHHQRLQMFVKSIENFAARVSFVALETIPRIDEIKALRLAMADIPGLSNTPYWISCLFPGEEGTLPDGNAADVAVEAMLDPKVSSSVPWAIGINCTKVWKLHSLLVSYESAISRLLDGGRILKWPSLVLYPDGTNGEIYDTTSREWVMPEGADAKSHGSWEGQLADVVQGTRHRGGWPRIIVGGCCMASAEHISRLRRKLLPEQPSIDN